MCASAHTHAQRRHDTCPHQLQSTCLQPGRDREEIHHPLRRRSARMAASPATSRVQRRCSAGGRHLAVAPPVSNKVHARTHSPQSQRRHATFTAGRATITRSSAAPSRSARSAGVWGTAAPPLPALAIGGRPSRQLAGSLTELPSAHLLGKGGRRVRRRVGCRHCATRCGSRSAGGMQNASPLNASQRAPRAARPPQPRPPSSPTRPSLRMRSMPHIPSASRGHDAISSSRPCRRRRRRRGPYWTNPGGLSSCS
jgi:hypothetical protein